MLTLDRLDEAAKEFIRQLEVVRNQNQKITAAAMNIIIEHTKADKMIQNKALAAFASEVLAITGMVPSTEAPGLDVFVKP